MRAAARGFTLVELMVVVTVMGILALAASGPFGRIIAAQRVRSMAGDLHLALVQARSEAVKRNAAVTLAPAGGDWSAGWSVADPEDADAAPLATYTPASGVEVQTTLSQVVFAGSGRTTLAAEASFLVRSSHTDLARCVVVAPVGRPVVKEASAC